MNVLREAQLRIKARVYTSAFSSAIYITGFALLWLVSWKAALGVWLINWAFGIQARNEGEL